MGSILVIYHHDHRFILLPDFLPACYKIYLQEDFPLFSLSILSVFILCLLLLELYTHDIHMHAKENGKWSWYKWNDDDEKARVKINLDTWILDTKKWAHF